MLGKPWCGWSEITVNGDRLGTASYLDWLPGTVLNPCINYLTIVKNNYDKWQTPFGEYGFNIEFDAEGWHFGIVEIGDDFYTYDTRGSEPPYINLKEIDAESYDYQEYKFVLSILKETIKDIEAEFDGWVEWDAYDDEDKRKNQDALNTLLSKAKEIEKQIEEIK